MTRTEMQTGSVYERSAESVFGFKREREKVEVGFWGRLY
jgi:hypothetical protein